MESWLGKMVLSGEGGGTAGTTEPQNAPVYTSSLPSLLLWCIEVCSGGRFGVSCTGCLGGNSIYQWGIGVEGLGRSPGGKVGAGEGVVMLPCGWVLATECHAGQSVTGLSIVTWPSIVT